jgi:hypothetical protein
MTMRSLWLMLLVLTGCMMRQGVAPASITASDECLIFFYRDSQFTGSIVTARIYDSGVKIGELTNGSYFSYKATPGEHHLHAGGSGSRGIMCKPGEVFYVRAEVRVGFLAANFQLSLEP